MPQRDIATLLSNIVSQFADNTAGDITAEDLRNYFQDLVDSSVFRGTGTLSNNIVPVVSSDGQTMISSSISEETTQISTSKMLFVPDAQGVMFGAIQITNGGFNIAAETLDGRVFYPIASELRASGSDSPNWIKLSAQTTTPAAADTSETFTGPRVQFKIINQNTGLAERYTFNAAASSLNNNLVIRLGSHTSNDVIFDYRRATGSAGFDLSAGENDIDLPGVGLFFRAGVELFATIEPASGNISLRGQTLTVGGTQETIPYIEVLGRTSTDVKVLTNDDVGTGAGDLVQLDSQSRLPAVDASQLTGLPDANLTIQDSGTQEGTGIATLNFAGGLNVEISSGVATISTTPITPPSQEAFYHGLSATDIPATIALGSLTQADVTTGTGQQFSFDSGTATVGNFLILLVPSDHDITTIINTGTNLNERPSFVRTADVRQISSQNYNSYVLGPLVGGFTASYQVTLA